jgi:hypothetical protein
MRVSDVRATQVWDQEHLVSRVLRQQLTADEPNCCEKEGLLWDLIAIYPKSASLHSKPVFVAGPVVKAADSAKKHLSAEEKP